MVFGGLEGGGKAYTLKHHRAYAWQVSRLRFSPFTLRRCDGRKKDRYGYERLEAVKKENGSEVGAAGSLQLSKFCYLCTMSTSTTKLENSWQFRARVVEEAKKLASLGFRVFPSHNKAPVRGCFWQQEATSDVDKVQPLFENHKDFTGVNIAIDKNVVVIDFDIDILTNKPIFSDDPRLSPWNEYDLPPTVVCVSGGGGRHYYYRLPEDVPSGSFKLSEKNDGEVKIAVELQGYGRSVVAPPSIHPDSKDEYKWLPDHSPFEREVAPAPAWLVEKIREKEHNTVLAYTMKPPIQKGARHNYLVSLAGVLVKTSLTDEAIEDILREICQNPDLFEYDSEVEQDLKYLRQYYPKWREEETIKIRVVLKKLPKEIAEIVAKRAGVSLEETKKNTNKAVPQKLTGKKLLEAVIDALSDAEWTMYNNQPHIIMDNKVLPTEAAIVYLVDKKELPAGKDTIKQAIDYIVHRKTIKKLEGIVLSHHLVVGEADGIRGIWRHEDETLYCHTADGQVLSWPKGEWPKGVYVLGQSAGIGLGYYDDKKAVLDYYQPLAVRSDASAGVLVALTALMDLGYSLGLILTGPAGSGKSTFADALAYLECGDSWPTPVGNSMRDHVAALVNQRVTYFDDPETLSPEIQSLLRTKITRGKARVRKLYSDTDVVELDLNGSFVACTTSIQRLTHDLLDRCFVIVLKKKKSNTDREELKDFFQKMSPHARAALIKVWQEAQKLPEPVNIPSWIRFKEWYKQAYRIAVVLGVEQEFVRYIRTSKLRALGALKFRFIMELLLDNEEGKIKLETNRAYSFKELGEMAGMNVNDVDFIRLLKGLGSGDNNKNRREIELIASHFGYDVVFTHVDKNGNGKKKELAIKFIKDEDEDGDLPPLPPIPPTPPTHPTPPTPPTEPTPPVEPTPPPTEPVEPTPPPMEPTPPTPPSQSMQADSQPVVAQNSVSLSKTNGKAMAEHHIDFEPLKVKEWNDYVNKLMEGEVEEYQTDHHMLSTLKKQLEEYKSDPILYLDHLTNRLNKPQAIQALHEPQYKPLLLYMLHELARARKKVLEITKPMEADTLNRILAELDDEPPKEPPEKPLKEPPKALSNGHQNGHNGYDENGELIEHVDGRTWNGQPLYPRLLIDGLETEVTLLMLKGVKEKDMEYSIHDEYVKEMRVYIQQVKVYNGYSALAEYIANFINGSSEIMEDEYKHLRNYLLVELAKARIEVNRYNTLRLGVKSLPWM